MPVVRSISVTRSGYEALGKKDLQSALRRSMETIGKLHHRIIKARHFQRSAARKYKHRKRDRRYVLLKIRKGKAFGSRAIGEGTDLVFSGTTRRLVMRSNKIKATAASSARAKVDVIMNAPALNFSGMTGIDMRGELERTYPPEEADLFKQGRRRYYRELDRVKRTKTTKHKV